MAWNKKSAFIPGLVERFCAKLPNPSFPPKSWESSFFWLPLFFNWFPIIFADEITALPARKLDLAIGVSVGSSTQIALFVVPVARRILLVLFEVQIEVGGPLNELWEDFSLQTAFFSCGKVSIFAASSVGIWNGVFWWVGVFVWKSWENSGRSYVEDFFFAPGEKHRSQSWTIEPEHDGCQVRFISLLPKKKQLIFHPLWG